MTAAELRIGNYVNYYDRFTTIEIRHLKYILEESKCFKPIPITEEILLKCGFTIFEERFIHNKNERLYVSIINPIAKHLGNQNGVLAMIDYLHQLQNLYFALCGEELKINL